MANSNETVRQRWARLRFSVIGPLLAAPPDYGELAGKLQELAAQSYRHPTTQESIRFAASTIERWLYQAQNNPDDPLGALARKVPSHTGQFASVDAAVQHALRVQHKAHPRWTYQLHYDNLVALWDKRPEPERQPLPSYATITRFMKAAGLIKQKRRKRVKGKQTDPDRDFTPRERRSFEVKHVHGLWHADFHVGSRRVLLPSGSWSTAYLLGFIDDRSRLCCHLQWYLHETAEAFCHGLSQAILKRGLPRALLTDNGKPMTAGETLQGLERLGIVSNTTLPYSPEQNAKQECFWGQVEGRLMAMLEGKKELTLALLNEATQAWVELEYHRRIHRELGSTPLQAMQTGVSLGRQAPSPDTLRHAFRVQEQRTLRRSDGTLSVMGVRFEVPQRYVFIQRPTVRFARWDLSSVDLVDPHSDTLLCELRPIDKQANADGRRRVLDSQSQNHSEESESAIAPKLASLMQDYAETGLPPAYIPLNNHDNHDNHDNQSSQEEL